jgi:hypothetical protein
MLESKYSDDGIDGRESNFACCISLVGMQSARLMPFMNTVFMLAHTRCAGTPQVLRRGHHRYYGGA